MTAAAVIVAAGRSERFGSSSKVLAQLQSRPVLEFSIDAFDQAESIAEIVIVVGEHTEAAITQLISNGAWSTPISLVRGGASRQESTANGVDTVSASADVILVHDAARPMILPTQIEACIVAARQYGGAILAAPVTDTIKRVEAGHIESTIDRSTLWAAQTPQAFRAELLRAMISSDAADVTDEASLAEYLGYPVQIVPGDATNLKITHLPDLIVAEALLRARKDQS